METLKTRVLQLRLTPDEKEAFEQAAAIASLSQAAWARERLRAATIRELERAGVRIPFVKPILPVTFNSRNGH